VSDEERQIVNANDSMWRHKQHASTAVWLLTASSYTELTECSVLCTILSGFVKLFHYNNFSYFGVMRVPESNLCQHSGTSELSFAYFICIKFT